MPAVIRRRKITDTWARKAPAGLTWDARAPQLALRVQPTGNRSWIFVYRMNNRPRWYTIGSALSIEVADARKLVVGLAAKVAAGTDPMADKRAARTAGTFLVLRERYLEYAKRKNKSWRQANRYVLKYLAPHWDKLNPAKITRSDARVPFRALADTPIQANQMAKAGSAIFSWAISEEIGGVTINPFSGIKHNETNERERVLSPSEVPQVWAALDDVDPVKAVALRVVLLTGARPGEVTCMRREHIRDAWWEKPGKPDAKLQWPGMKNWRSHHTWLPQVVREMIDIDGVGFVFESVKGGPIGPLDDAMREVSAALGLDTDETKITPHDLRRTFGSTVTGRGHGRDAMDRLLAHYKKSVTNVYDRAKYEAVDRSITEDVCGHLLRLAQGEPVPSNVLPLVANTK